MRFEHRLGLLPLLGLGAIARVLFHFIAFRGNHGAIGANFENLIQAKTGKKFVAAIAAVDNVKVAFPKFAQPKRDRGQRSHKRRIHHRAIFQINYELAVTAVDHLLREFFQTSAVEEVTLAFHSHPNGGAVHAH